MAFREIEVLDVETALNLVAKPEDMFRLGLMYASEAGDRGPDFVESHKWFSLAAAMGHIPSKVYRDELKLEMTAQELTLAQRAARAWMAEYKTILAG